MLILLLFARFHPNLRDIILHYWKQWKTEQPSAYTEKANSPVKSTWPSNNHSRCLDLQIDR